MAWNPSNTRQPFGSYNYSNKSLGPTGGTQNRGGDPSNPSQFATQYLRPGLNMAQSYVNQGVGFNPYTGNRVANFTNNQEKYFDGVHEKLRGTPQYMQRAQNAVGSMAGGGATNPYFKDVLNQQLDDVQNRVNASTSGMGRYGSGAHTSVLTQELADASSRALNENYFGEQGLKLQAASMAPAMQQAEITRLNEMLKAGSLQQSQRQDQINAARDLFNEQQQAPWSRLNAYMASIGQPGAGNVMPQQTQSQPQASTAQRALGGAMTGASIGGMFGQPLLGGLAGGALGLFG